METLLFFKNVIEFDAFTFVKFCQEFFMSIAHIGKHHIWTFDFFLRYVSFLFIYNGTFHTYYSVTVH